VRALGVFNDAHFDLPGCQHVERAPIDPARAVLPEDFAPSHAFSEGDNCILHVARRAPTDAAVHAITVDTDAVVMLSCVIMLNPDNEGLWQPTRHAKQRVYWHSAIDMRAAAGSSTKERVWALHTLVDQFMQHRVAPHMLLATAILTGCDFLPHTHSITNISAENVWRAALEAAKGESHFNFPTDMSARGVLSHIATEVICSYAGIDFNRGNATTEFITEAWAQRKCAAGRRLPSIKDENLLGTLFGKAWGYLFDDVLRSPALELMHPDEFMRRTHAGVA